MPRYYFHAVKNRELLRDEEGEELPNAEWAKNTALQAARELVAEDLKHDCEANLDALVIEDEEGRHIFLALAEAIPRRLRS